MLGDYLSARGALLAACPEDNDDLAMASHLVEDEAADRINFHPLSTPAEILRRGRVALAQQVNPEGIVCLWHHLVCTEGQALLLGTIVDLAQYAGDQVDHYRGFNQGVGAHDINMLMALLWLQFCNGRIDQR